MVTGVTDSDKGLKKIADDLVKEATPIDEPVKDQLTPESELTPKEQDRPTTDRPGLTELKGMDDPKPGYGPISEERWQEAQKAERQFHNMEYMEGMLHYAQSYKHYFAFVGLGHDLGNLNVIEVGPADFPALAQCKGDGVLIVCEPMPSELLEQICAEKNIMLKAMKFEEFNLDSSLLGGRITEVWLFNVMQHIQDPERFIRMAKVADRVRFFEPIDWPVAVQHPHTYTLKDFQNWFGDCVQLYTGGSVAGFHEADCAYGVWIQK